MADDVDERRRLQEYLESNRQNWNERTPIHAASDFYDVDGFRAGKSSLKSIELQELGDVSGKSMLHLQCHFGLDTLSWARLGAAITGVDFSDKAIELARSLSMEVGIEAEYVRSDIYDLPDALHGQYDIVFTSYGVLNWLPDIPQWAKVASHFVTPGGVFYMVEFHPFADVFDDENESPEPRVRYPYPSQDSAVQYYFEPGATYTEGVSVLSTPTFEWSHSLGDIITSLISAGLRVEYLHEFMLAGYKARPTMVQASDGWWRLPEGHDSIPEMFSLMATKPLGKG